MKPTALLAALALFAGACTGTPSPGISPAAGASLKLASWNMEHLAERNGSGCRPRTDADYAAMRAYVDDLGADVIAFTVIPDDAHIDHIGKPETAGQNGHVQRVASGEEHSPVKVKVNDIVADAEKSVCHAGLAGMGGRTGPPPTLGQYSIFHM